MAPSEPAVSGLCRDVICATPRSTPHAWEPVHDRPWSTRNALVLIVVGNLTAVFIGGVVVWLVDRREFET